MHSFSLLFLYYLYIVCTQARTQVVEKIGYIYMCVYILVGTELARAQERHLDLGEIEIVSDAILE